MRWGVAVRVILQLAMASLLCSALDDAQGSPDRSPSVSPVDGPVSSPISQGVPLTRSAPSPVPPWNESTSPPPLASPPLAPSPIPSEGTLPSFPPSTSAEAPLPSSSASPHTAVSRSTSSPPPDTSPIKAPIVESPKTVPAPRKQSPTPTPLVSPPPRSLSPITTPSVPESSPPSSGRNVPPEEPIAPVPVASPISVMPRNSSAVPPLPSKVHPSRSKDHRVSPAEAPSHERSKNPVAAPPSPLASSPPPESHSPVHTPATSPSASSRHRPKSKAVSPVPAPGYVVSPPASSWEGPIVAPVTTPTSMRRHNAPSPMDPGYLILPPHSASPSPIHIAPAASPLPSPEVSPAPPRATSPSISPGPSSVSPELPLLPKMPAFPPPPPNTDCLGTVCMEPYTNTPPGSPCGCVWPMQVGLRLSVDLYTFFPLVSEFALEIAAGVFMKQSQVRIIGANAATQQPEKTVVLIDLVPLGDKFDSTTALLTDQRFWRKQVSINAAHFGDYDVLYVRYPGLPPSPPLPPSDVTVVDDGPYSGNDNNARTNKPLGVDLPRRRRNRGLSGSVVAVVVLSAIVAVVSCSAVVWILLLRRRERSGSQQDPTPQALLLAAAKSSGTGGSLRGSRPSSSSLSFGSSIATYAGSAKTFAANDIEKATDNFDASRVLGEGGFGRVYSGTLDDGTRVAVKVLKRDDQQGGREFLAEVEMLSRLHHRNLVKLIGICTEDRARCLVYELIPNGSLESHLHGVDKETVPLDWTTRMKIALGAARGLAYLHEDSSPRVIHRDFKSSNILLEHDYTPKVADFGLARTALDEESQQISTRVMGTFGYVAPEYAMTGHLLVKSDVYSYGVVLLELLTGRKPVDMSQPPGQENLVSWARPLLTSEEGLEVMVDKSLGPNVPLVSIGKVAAIASMCVQPEVSHRPFMGEVVQALKLVCAECDEARGEGDGSRNSSREDLSVDLSEAAEATSVGPSTFHDAESGLSISDLLSSTSVWYGRQVSGSFRRHSSSGPLGRTVRGQRFWQRIRRLSGGSASEHGIVSRPQPGSH